MGQLLRDVTEGWRELITDGKYMTLLLVALMYLWFEGVQSIKRQGRGTRQGEEEAFWLALVYTTFILIVTVLPPVGIFLRIYQTRFYDYTWVLAYIPMTLVVAYGTTRLFIECCEGQLGRKVWKEAGLAAVILAIFVLCGNLQSEGPEAIDMDKKAAQIIDVLKERREDNNIDAVCLWAPQEVLTYVRMQDGEVTLLYGRNMWEDALNAYSYDTYLPEIEEAYNWMEECSAYLRGDGQEKEFQKDTYTSVKAALSQGANCVLLPVEADGVQEDGVILSVMESMEKAGYNVIKDQTYGYNIFWVY